MGAGKSTVGRLLAQALERPFVDSDDQLERRVGMKITEYFETHVEAEFRHLELSELRDELSSSVPSVIATGGGIVTTAEGRELLRRSGSVIFLDVSPEAAARRVGDARTRPLLQGDPLGKLEQLEQQRHDHYREVADVIIQVDGRSPGAVVGAILDELEVSS